MPELTHEQLLRLLDYDPWTGELRWRVPQAGRAAGRVIAGFLQPAGKRRKPAWAVGIGGRRYMRARVAWFWMTGSWPVAEIDHRNGDSMDDRWSNLREATREQNERNKGPYKNNRLGIKGVCRRSNGRYHAQIYRGRKISLGYFDSPEAARSAYLRVAAQTDGEFLRR